MKQMKVIGSIAAITMGYFASGNMAAAEDDEDDVPFPVAVMLIELTEEDIELQFFADGHWGRFTIEDPRGRKVYDSRVGGKLRRQHGVSEAYFASVPSHYLPSEPDFDEPIARFLRRWPEGFYDFESVSLDGDDFDSDVWLSHLMPALPEIVWPPAGDDPLEIMPGTELTIDWEPVTTDFLHGKAVEIVEYQLIVDQVEPERENPWIDGSTRRALINLPASVTEYTMDADFFDAGAEYEIEILAIEKNGNATISVGEFVVSE